MNFEDKARAKLIQVAAVAVAIVEDLDYGEANFAGVRSNRSPLWYRGDDVLVEVANERMAQDEKWGPQHHSPMEWLAILGEEFGEACRAASADHG